MNELHVPNEFEVLIKPLLITLLDDCKARIEFRSQEEDVPDGYRQKEDFKSLTQLAIVSQKLNYQSDFWLGRVKSEMSRLSGIKWKYANIL